MLDMNTYISALSPLCSRVMIDEPLMHHTTFRIGGKADIIVFPQSLEELTAVLHWHHQNAPALPLCVLGRGSNVLFDDDGYRGLVIVTTDLQQVSITPKDATTYTVIADCGVSLTSLSKMCGRYTPALSGLGFAYGIPGSVGGAVVMNAGAYGGEMSDVVVSVDYYDMTTQTIKTAMGQQLDFAYRHSIFQDNPHYLVLSATLSLPVGDADAIDAEMKNNMKARREKQPLELPNAGSVFKRPEGLFVGKMVQDCGLKGYCIGGAQVSEKHAGFIVNTGGATAKDVLALIEHIKQVIFQAYGVSLICEIKYISNT